MIEETGLFDEAAEHADGWAAVDADETGETLVRAQELASVAAAVPAATMMAADMSASGDAVESALWKTFPDLAPAEVRVGQPVARSHTAVCDQHLASFLEGVRALEFRAREIDTIPLGGNDHAHFEMSLVHLEEREGDAVEHSVHTVHVVAWTSPERLMGRRMRLRSQKILALVPAIMKVDSFVESPRSVMRVVAPTIHEFPHRKKFDDAPVVLPVFLKLKAMWEVALGGNASIDVCVLCQSDLDGEGNETELCALCMMPWHSTCSKTLAVDSVGSFWDPYKAGSSHLKALPDCFRLAQLCSLCQGAMASRSAASSSTTVGAIL